MGEFRTPLQLFGCHRCVDIAALELHRNRDESVFIGADKEKNIVTSSASHRMSRKREVRIYQNSRGWHILHGYPASVSSARIAEVFCAYS